MRSVVSVCLCVRAYVHMYVMFRLLLLNVLPRNFTFGTQMHFQNIYVKVEYQGHGVKVKVI